jgi:hypothetical protein
MGSTFELAGLRSVTYTESIEGNGKARGFFRRASATGGASSDSSRRGATATGLCLLLVLSVAALLGASSASAAPPLVTIGAPQNPSYTTVEVSGEVDPEGETITWLLEVSGDSGATWELPGGFEFENNFGELSGTGFQSIGTKMLKGLKPGTTYLVRLTAYNFSDFQEIRTPEPNPSFTTEALPDPTLSIDPVTIFTGTTAHFSGKVDPNAPVGDPAVSDVRWHFECTPTCPGIEAESVVNAAEGEQEVEVDATGLEPNTNYEVKLVGANAGGSFETAPQTFKTAAIAPSATTTPPLLLGGKVLLGGRVNPRNSVTKFWIEYGTTTAYGSVVPATENGDAGSDGEFLAVSKAAANLQPGTTYHARLVAENAVDRTDGQDIEFTIPGPPDPNAACPNEAIRAEQEVDLPDCRAYELISRGDGNFGNVSRVTGASDDGEKISYFATAAEGPAASAFYYPGYVGARTPSGWSTLNASPVPPQNSGPGIPRGGPQGAVSDDFSKVLILTTASLDPRDDDEAAPDIYLVDVPSGKVSMVSAGPGPATTFTLITILGASPDLSYVYFHDREESLLPGVPPGSTYQWHEGQLTAFGQLGIAARPHTNSGFEQPPQNYAARLQHNGPHVTSDDGSVYFGTNAVRLSTDSGTIVDPATGMSVDPEAFSIGTPGTTFVGASRDGDVLYFANATKLTADASAGGGLYRYIHSTNELELLTPAAPGGLGISGALMSDDASRVYFTASAAVAPGAEPGASNLYVQEGDETRFILTLPNEARIARASRDGRHIVISTSASLAGAETNGHAALYEYDNQSGVLACASCRADGSPSQGDASLEDTQPATLGVWSSHSAPRSISDDGRVFFATLDRLVPEDQDAGSDVYEYFNGTVSLLSGGEGGRGSYVGDNSDDGRSVFFITSKSLIPEDRDGGLADIYDVRVGGGYPNPAKPQSACETNCQRRHGPPAASAVGSEGLAGSSSRGKISVKVPRSAQGVSVALKVKVNGSGTIRLTGGRVQSLSRTVAKAGSYTLKAVLRPRGRALLKNGGVVKAPVTVRFEPAEATSAEKSLTLTFRPSGTSSKGDHR